MGLAVGDDPMNQTLNVKQPLPSILRHMPTVLWVLVVEPLLAVASALAAQPAIQSPTETSMTTPDLF